MGNHERQEDRGQNRDRLLHSAEIQQGQHADGGRRHRELPSLPRGRQEAEHRIHAGGDGNRDGEHVVDDERRARHDPRGPAEQSRGHDVATATEREVLDDPAVGVGDDEDGERDGARHRDGEVPVRAERLEGFLGPVRR